MTTILCSVCAHARPVELYEQFLNYNAAVEAPLLHMAHISRDTQAEFAAEADRSGVDFRSLPNVHFNSSAYSSGTGVISSLLGFHYANVIEAIRLGLSFDYVLIHTSSDLFFRRLPASYIESRDIGCPWREHLYKEDPYYERATNDTHFFELCQLIVPDRRLRKGRVEGAFFRRDIFLELMALMLKCESFDATRPWFKNYPFEEIAVPTLVAGYMAKRQLRLARNLVQTTDGNFFETVTGRKKAWREAMTAQEFAALPALLKARNTAEEVFGVKFVERSQQDPVRLQIRQALGYEVRLGG
ncbi:hypothetical protein [Falsiroseomonas tokyonensis]|uniref:Uncharacterized protein n=1 Tax=Falsiroseomonas tokyonensis TaxID=430521 RepID=A0ABV7BTR4_9PROT|nr:hypothetical protein [Falsiroseomonas tokyonensis]MBU8538432.1 hypothetical protein [Falsiroseomonas tokyonensis]